jgi:cytochrome c oxidase assembly factor CtaG
MILLHAGQVLEPRDLWRAWSFEPGVILPLAVTTGLYVRGITRVLRRTTYARVMVKREMSFFAAGLLVLTIALVSPVHRAGSALFSAHMIQHELLMAAAAPLLVLGKPVAAFMWGLPRQLRRPASRMFSLSIAPLAAFLLHAAAIWTWHLPRLYDASVTSEFVHTAQHISFLASALLFWWSLFQSRSRKGSEGAAIMYLFLTGIHTTLLGALIFLSSTQFYSVYHDATTINWGLTAIEDQQLGGLIMWIPAGIVYLCAALYLMLRWLKQSAARAAKREAAYLYPLRQR